MGLKYVQLPLPFQKFVFFIVIVQQRQPFHRRFQRYKFPIDLAGQS